MFCIKCGTELKEGARFCYNCGCEVIETVLTKNEPIEQLPNVHVPVEQQYNIPNHQYGVNPPVNEEKKVWQIFAKLGFIFGLVSFITTCVLSLISFNPFIFLITYSILIICADLSTTGIIFSALGLKSKMFHSKAKKGLIFSIIATALAILVVIIFFVFIIALETDYYYYDDDYYDMVKLYLMH